MGKLYDSDFYGWTLEQADALKRKSLNEIDWDNLIEEIESLGRSELDQLDSRFIILLMHLLKWLLDPEQRTRSWYNTICEQRRRIRRLLEKNPGMAPKVDEIFADAYQSARGDASGEMNKPMSQFPAQNPFTRTQALDDNFWPGPVTDSGKAASE